MIKDIVGYEGLYKISDAGDVICCEKPIGKNGGRTQPEKVKSLRIRNGYGRVQLSRNDICKFYSVHRLVGEHFIPNPDNKPHINHIDGNKLNNNATNLEWVTRSENELHSIKIGLRQAGRKVIQMLLTGEVVKEWRSTALVQKELGFRSCNIHKCCEGQINKSSGFKWAWA